MQGWNLPLSLQNSVRYHTEPMLASHDRLEVSLVHIARFMASAIDTGQPLERIQLRVDTEAWQNTGLTVEQISEVHEKADQDTLAVVNSLFSNMATSQH